ncbi:hypothetical protein AcV5_007421 [Taiwanofungus camphoratus]|nr:hypothetical protein AcW2_007085 [Antrodia cinnamomea]KAI0926699.1 hypothetical protein AcV5_007421 [Antrodia cinnamomea]
MLEHESSNSSITCLRLVVARRTMHTIPQSDFAPHKNISPIIRFLSFLYTIYTSAVPYNPLIWSFRQGKNPQADFAGRYYVFGAPNRQAADGKVATASYFELNGEKVFIILVPETDHSGFDRHFLQQEYPSCSRYPLKIQRATRCLM